MLLDTATAASLEPAAAAALTVQAAVADPINIFATARVPFRTLAEHGAMALDWLSKRRDRTFHLVTENPDKTLSVENVDAVRFLERSHELGWKPWALTEEDYEGAPLTFYNAVPYKDSKGDWWFCGPGNTFDDFTGIPLCFPSEVIKRKRVQMQTKYRTRLWRERKRAREAAEQATQKEFDSLVDLLLGKLIARGKRTTREKVEKEVYAAMLSVAEANEASEARGEGRDIAALMDTACELASDAEGAQPAEIDSHCFPDVATGILRTMTSIGRGARIGAIAQ